MQEPSTASYCTMNHFRERFQANRVLTMCSSLGESLTLLIFLLGTGCLNSSSYADTGVPLHHGNCSSSRAVFEIIHLDNRTNCTSVNGNDSSLICTFSDDSIEYNLTLKETVNPKKKECHLVVCNASNENAEIEISCFLYKYDCNSSYCDTSNEHTEASESESDGGGGAVTGMAVFVALLCVALVAAVVAIVTLVLMVRQMQRERGGDKGLPNPYASCMVCFLPSDDQPPKTVGNKKKKAPAKSSHQTGGKAAVARAPRPQEDEEEDEGPDHDQDDYEEMEMKQREGSFTEEDDPDIYQNY